MSYTSDALKKFDQTLAAPFLTQDRPSTPSTGHFLHVSSPWRPASPHCSSAFGTSSLVEVRGL